MKVLGEYEPAIEKVLNQVKESQSRVQSSMMSPRIQNEIISIIGSEILRGIIEDVKKAGFYSIMSDEATAYNEQYLTIGVRYLNIESSQIKEDWISFVKLESADSETIFNTIVKSLEDAGLSLENCLGGAFDGASVMTGRRLCLSFKKKKIFLM